MKTSSVWIVRISYSPNLLKLTDLSPVSWMDHARDLLLMINHFREQMPRPLVGIGHSFGGNIMFANQLDSSALPRDDTA